jgi:hypothetical protein
MELISRRGILFFEKPINLDLALNIFLCNIFFAGCSKSNVNVSDHTAARESFPQTRTKGDKSGTKRVSASVSEQMATH